MGINSARPAPSTFVIVAWNDSPEVQRMQAILITWPILASAFLAGILLAWVLFVALPRMRRAKTKSPAATRAP
jgi:hypothetical protein